jgi:hypothetical protein
LGERYGKSQTEVAGEEQSDAIALLTEDHKKVQKLFKDFDKLKEEDAEEKEQIVRAVHAWN